MESGVLEGDGRVAGKLPFGNRTPDQLADTVAAAIVLLAPENPTVRTRFEKLILGSELTVTIRVDREDVGVYFVCPIVKLAVPTKPELVEYW